jgi:cytochrome c oxidase subunit II
MKGTMYSILLAKTDGSIWMPVQASRQSITVDWLFYFILAVASFFFLLIVGLMVFFIIRFRARPGHVAQKTPSKSMALEITWTAVPILVVLTIFLFGFKGFIDLATAPANAYEILVTAYKWSWAFTYPNGHVDENLHVPVDRPVRLVLSSEDVIHSLYIPAFRIKKDCVPGRYNKTWFQATRTGEYDLFCAEYCGTKHSDMIAKVVVHEPEEFKKWLEEAANWAAKLPPAEAGKKLFTARGCTQCHSVDGTGVIGPTLKDVFGATVIFKDQSRTVADENYVRESILNPQAKIVAGYEAVMPTYQGRLKDQEITAIIEYIKTLSAHYQPPASQPSSQSVQPAPGADTRPSAK